MREREGSKGMWTVVSKLWFEIAGWAEVTLWHEIITKIIPWELFFVIFEGFYALEMSRKERHFQGITREIRNFSEYIIISEYFFVSNNFVSEGKLR